MIGYRRRSFARLHSQLDQLKADRAAFEALWEVQILLLVEIFLLEEKIRSAKTRLRSSADDGAVTSIKSRSSLERRIGRYRQLNYIWRCFGDAIAFLYMDRFAIKQTFYNTRNINPKQSSGFVGGKGGLKNELSLVRAALQHKVPAILVDLTNSIRHGDVCLMGASDPHLIEVKTASRQDNRGRRQRTDIGRLYDFFETDRSLGLRGSPELVRVALSSPFRYYVEDINLCIHRAVTNGYAVSNPERGLYYLVVTEKKPSNWGDGLQGMALGHPRVFFLNETKNDRTWSPYSPFVLSILNRQHLYDFIRGQFI